jgi:hypothetical protein
MQSTPSNGDHVAEYYDHMMDGHVFIRDTMQALLETADHRIRQRDGRMRVLQLGSHAGIVTQTFLARWPNIEITIHDDDRDMLSLAQERLAGRSVRLCGGPLRSLDAEPDLVLSIARHHHLPHDYLQSLREIMPANAVYVLADELCPEYCNNEQRRRIEEAEVLHIERGYVLTSRAYVADFHEKGALPEAAIELERSRRKALWHWYRFVADYAVEKGYFDVAAAELRSACDDFITGSDAEHKFGPAIVERQFALAGFRQLSKRSVGSAEDPTLQSMFIYEYAPA